MELKEEGTLFRGQPSNIHTDDNTRVRLEQLGITPNQSFNYQAMAAIPEPVFDELVKAKPPALVTRGYQ